jgi:glycosyltransferase involved in cell wall biosynthesis
MATTPLVSLLIPTFNSALTVGDAIESCRQQTLRDVEILIYDETSRDGTREIIQAAAQQDARIRCSFSDTNSGPVRAWRKLLLEARGKYSTFVWADDLILPRYAEALTAVFRENPAQVIASCNAYSELLPATAEKGGGRSGLSGEASRRLLHEFPACRVRGDVYALGILAGVFPVSQICGLWETAAAREVFDHYIEYENPYGFDFSRHAYGNDVSFMSELGLRSGELAVLNEPLVVCRASPTSMTVNAHRTHRWQYWLQYVWAIRHAWRSCRALSPRMDALIGVVDDRVSMCDFFYSLQNRRLPREFNALKIARALWFLKREDYRLNKKAGPASLEAHLARHSRGRRE